MTVMTMTTRSRLVARVLVGGVCVASCTFSAHPPSGKQACSTDDPPQCADGYTCVSGACYINSQLPSAGGSGGNGDASTGDACTPAVIVCGSGSGKRCGKVSDLCTGSIECGACIAGETCGTAHGCSVACGQLGQECCAGSKCTATATVCDNGACIACGGPSQICCANDTCVVAGATCSDSPVTGGSKTCLLGCPATLASCASGADADCSALCGPSRIGSRTCTCSGNAWKCLSCTFPAADYSCYKLPATVAACDGTAVPTVGTACAAPSCSACGSSTGKGFVDVLGVTRAGYCVCDNNHRWACSVTKDWPCPGNTGC